MVRLGEVGRVRVSDGDVVVEACAAQDELFAERSGFAEEVLGVVGEDAEDHVVECFGAGRRAGVGSLAVVGFGVGVEGACFEGYSFAGGAREDGRYVGVEADVDALGA